MSPLTVPITILPMGSTPVSASRGRRISIPPFMALAASSTSGTNRMPSRKSMPTIRMPSTRPSFNVFSALQPRSRKIRVASSTSAFRPLYRSSWTCSMSSSSFRSRKLSSPSGSSAMLDPLVVWDGVPTDVTRKGSGPQALVDPFDPMAHGGRRGPLQMANAADIRRQNNLGRLRLEGLELARTQFPGQLGLQDGIGPGRPAAQMGVADRHELGSEADEQCLDLTADFQSMLQGARRMERDFVGSSVEIESGRGDGFG